MRGGLAVPEDLFAPVRRRRHRIVLVRRRIRIAHRHLERRRGVLHRIENRNEIGRILDGAVDQAVWVERRLAFVGRRDVMQVMLGIGEIPLRDDGVAFLALRPRWLCGRQFARSDPVGPVGVKAERALRIEPADCRRHIVHRLTGQNASRPGVLGFHVGEHGGNRARCLVAERVAAVAAVGLRDVQPLDLALGIAERKLALRRRLEHRIPVDRRIDFSRSLRRCRRGGEVDDLARLAPCRAESVRP